MELQKLKMLSSDRWSSPGTGRVMASDLLVAKVEQYRVAATCAKSYQYVLHFGFLFLRELEHIFWRF